MAGVYPVLTGEAEFAETSDFQGGSDERAQECPSHALRPRADCPAGRERQTVGSLGGEERNVTRQRVRSSSEGVFLCENYAYVAATPRSGLSPASGNRCMCA